MKNIKWKTAKSAPKDKQFIAKLKDYPALVICRYSEASEVWAYAALHVSQGEGVYIDPNTWNNQHFIACYCDLSEIEAWTDMPEVR